MDIARYVSIGIDYYKPLLIEVDYYLLVSVRVISID
jgi:hypothetical protein